MKNLILNVAASIIVTSLICYSCKKSDDSPANSNKIDLGSTSVDSVSYSWIKVSTQFNSSGGNQIIQHGHCWGTNSEPNLDNAHSSLGSTSNAISFTGKPEGLNENTLYYIRPYVSYSGGTIFGNEVTAFTLKTGKPSVVTANISELTLYSAVSGGTVLNDSGKIITAYGICWDLQQSPDINNYLGITNDGSGTGEFQSSMTDLSENTEYFVRAYATNANGTSYGEVISFITAELFLPSVNTTQISNITINSVDCSGEVLDAGNGNVYQKGTCWGTTNDITLTNCMGYSEEGTGIGSFTTNITGLNHGTVYYVKAYATNEKGTGYGEAKDFTTVEILLPTLGTTEVTNITFNGADCGGTVSDAGNGNISARGVCWSTQPGTNLENCEGFTTDGTGVGSYTSILSGLSEITQYYVVAYATNEAGNAYGEELDFLTKDLDFPDVTTKEITNISYFSASGGGNVINGGNGNVSARGVCWSTDPSPSLLNAEGYTDNGTGIGEFASTLTNLNHSTTYYVAAYATNEMGTAYGSVVSFPTLILELPSVETTPIITHSYHSAEGGGMVNSAGSGSVVTRGVCWGVNPNPRLDNCTGFSNDGSGTGGYLSYITGLSEGTQYYVCAYATNSLGGTGYGEDVTFTTFESCGIITYSGQEYKTIIIGDQCWMAENINVGEMINSSSNQTNNGLIEKYCYQNDPEFCVTYGGLYQWDEVFQYNVYVGARGICPSGWHIASDEEWKKLEGFADSQYPIGDPEWDNYGNRGFDAGKNLKSDTNNYNGIDKYGFNALPGGLKGSPAFVNIGTRAYFWCIKYNTDALDRVLPYDSDQISRNDAYTSQARSIRCIKD